MLVLWDKDGVTKKKVLFKDTFQPNGECGSYTPGGVQCINPQTDENGNRVCWDNACQTSGSFGFDSENNLYVSASSFLQGVLRFQQPIPTPQSGKTYSANLRMFHPPSGMNNIYGKRGFNYANGIVTTDSQTIIADGHRIMFWNTPGGISDISNFEEADGVAGATDFDKGFPGRPYGKIRAYQDKLWVLHRSNIEVYNLPLTHGAQPVNIPISSSTPLSVLGGGTLSWHNNTEFMGLDFDSTGNLWLTQYAEYYPIIHRALRVRDPYTNPVVDVVLGQADATGTLCNRWQDPNYPPSYDYEKAYTYKEANTVCFPGAIRVDRYDNVWLSDFQLEFKGNWRLMKYDKNLFDNISTQALFGPSATRIIPDTTALDMAFDSANRLVTGINGYRKLFMGIYDSPDTDMVPGRYFSDLFSQATSVHFDSNDNLLATDANRGRVLLYKQPFNNPPISPSLTSTISSTPSLPPVLSCSDDSLEYPDGICTRVLYCDYEKNDGKLRLNTKDNRFCLNFDESDCIVAGHQKVSPYECCLKAEENRVCK